MALRRTFTPVALLLLCFIFMPRAAHAQTPAPDIAYTISMPAPPTHLLHVELRVRAGERNAGSLPAPLELVMPVWTPGSYLVREFERHVQDFAATDADGRALAWRKVNKDTWRIEAG